MGVPYAVLPYADPLYPAPDRPPMIFAELELAAGCGRLGADLRVLLGSLESTVTRLLGCP